MIDSLVAHINGKDYSYPAGPTITLIAPTGP